MLSWGVAKVILTIEATLIGALSDHDHWVGWLHHHHSVVDRRAQIVACCVDRRRGALAVKGIPRTRHVVREVKGWWAMVTL